MPPRKPPTNEGRLQAYAKAQAEGAGVLWRKLAFEGQRGCPDTLMAYGGAVVFVELKHPGGTGRISRLQEYQLERLRDAGVDARIINTRAEIDAVIDELTGATTT